MPNKASNLSIKPTPPQAKRIPQVSSLHGERLVDDYAWLRAPNWREVLRDPNALPDNIRIHLEAENAYTDSILSETISLRERLVQEMRGRIKEDDASVPIPDGPYAYFTRYREGGQHQLVCRSAREGGEETILLDGDQESLGHPFFDLGVTQHSPDHRLLAWSADLKGSEYFAIRIRNLESGSDLSDHIAQTSGDMVWLQDGSGFYYVEFDEDHRPRHVKRHRLGEPQDRDFIVYTEKDAGFFVHLGKTQSGVFATISAGDHETSEVYLLDLSDASARPRLVEARQVGLRYDVDHGGDTLFILTNADEAEDFKIVTAPVDQPGRSFWRDAVPYRQGVMILSHAVFAHYLVRLEREEACPRIVVRPLLKVGAEHVIAFEEEAYSLGLETGYEFDTHILRYRYSSLTTPEEVVDCDLLTDQRVTRKRQDIPSGHDPRNYITQRLFAKAPDGEMIPISLVRRRETPIDGSAPCLLYGYGAYGISIPASFRSNILSLLDRGMVYAIAHIRGGTEKGWRWYQDGKRAKKTNTFNDFISCARTLIEEGYTTSGRIVAYGGSAGGMLMGAIANLAPELFAAIVAEVPFVDVINTMLDASLPLTPPEWPEWGNPSESVEEYRTIRAYSPYDNVRPQAYPPILALGGLTDPRVTYWEPAKWVARLREVMTGGGPILLKLHMDSGHGGAAGRFDRLEEVALSYAFALKATKSFIFDSTKDSLW